MTAEIETSSTACPQATPPCDPGLMVRGRTYYWRARVCVAIDPQRAHLTISLATRDWDEARRRARRCWVVMDDVSREAATKPVTRKYLAKRLKAMLAEANERHDDLAVTGKRFATDPHRVREEAVCGLAHSLSYRLLTVFGRCTTLAFDEECPGLAWLRDQKVHADVIDKITSGAHAALVEMNRVKGYGRQHRASLVADGRDTSPLAIERLLETNHLAQAEALGDIERRYGVTLAADEPLVRSNTLTAAPTNSLPIIADVRKEEALKDGVGVSFQQMEASVDTFLRRHRERWDEKTQNQARQTVDLFFRVLRDENVSSSTDIRQSQLGAFRDLLDVLPARYGQTPSLRVLDAAGLREAGVRLAREGKPSGLSVGTINRHLTHLDAYISFLKGQGWATAALDVAPLKPRVRRGEGKRSKAEKPPFSSFSRLFQLPPFTGSRSHSKQGWPGRHIYHSGVFYAPILLAYLGARRNEICSLQVDDVFEGDGGWALRLAPNELRGLKKDWSRRVLPLPEEVIRLGFLDYTSTIKYLGYDVLFPDLFHKDRGNDPGDRLYKVLASSRERMKASDVAMPDWTRFMHSLRHSVNDHMKQSGVDEATRRDILGHKPEGTNEEVYVNALNVGAMRKALACLPSVTDHLPKPDTISLLPWVKRKQSAPWQKAKLLEGEAGGG